MRRLFPLLARLAASSVSVLIEGETGTGKEVVARAIHRSSPRGAGPLVVLDCSAIAPTLIESELFGHERGAFTGAAGLRRGVFEQADGGSLFIDELGELPLDLQARLLRALERSEVRRLGGSEWIRCDVRVIAATRRDIDKEVLAGRFRDDLFHRVAVGRVELPPLRERTEDIPALAAHFAREVEGSDVVLPARLLAAWSERPWPGNVRELRNAVHRHLAVGDLEASAAAGPEALPPPPPAATGSEIDAVIGLNLTFPEARDRIVAEFQRRYLGHALAAAGGNVPRAAQIAGIAPRYFRLLRTKG